jgi:hypothetical protein
LAFNGNWDIPRRVSGVLIDANIFVYAFDPADPDKHE